MVKNLSASVGDKGSVPGSGRSPGGGNGNPLQYSRLENPMDREAWQATVHGVAKSWTWLKRVSTHTHLRMKSSRVGLSSMLLSPSHSPYSPPTSEAGLL